MFEKQNQPVYEIITREDLTAAFRDAMTDQFALITAQLQTMIDLYSATAPSSLWTWDQTSRWDFDMWW